MNQRQRKKYLRVPDDVRKKIINYFLEDSNTIDCSGMKEYVSIKDDNGQTIKVQKKILIYNINELYNNYVKQNQHTSVPSLPFFAQLRPKQCVFADAPGMHNVCVCAIHQNIKLKLSAVKLTINYKELIAAGVCFADQKNCMLHECDECPKADGIRHYLSSVLMNTNMTHVEYSNWVTVNITNSDCSSSSRMILDDFTEPLTEFIENLSEDIWKMTEHHFVSTQQKEYFIHCKQNLNSKTGLLIMDFAENYTCICQNSVQAFYSTNIQVSLFTASLYYKDENSDELKVANFCVISDNLKHEAYSVNIYMEKVIEQIKHEFPWITDLHEFSDGSPQQFKNK